MAGPSSGALWREGDFWTLHAGGRDLRLKDSKGLGYLAVLIERPGVDVHVLELAAASDRSPAARPARAGDAVDLRGDEAGGAGPALDEQAKAAYRARVEELREELAQAQEWADDERAARARQELDALAEELARSVGLGGRDRPVASQAERARQSVGRAIRNVVRHVAASSPELGAHLERAVRTGLFCSYRPEPEPALAFLPHPPERAGEREGTVVFMLTDVEASTRLYERHPDEAAGWIESLAERIAGQVIRAGGTAVKERGEGDSTFSVFSRASDAIACALELQLSLQREPLSHDAHVGVRIGLHAGEAELRDGDYHGLEVNRCARIRDIAHGGQVLVSAAAAALAGERLPAGAALRDLGSHRLRDIDRAEQVFQLVHPDIRDDFPPPRSLDARPHNLPVLLTSFVGREQELRELGTLLDNARLVTLTGAGGSGKTRLALELAWSRWQDFAGGAWLVDLAPVAEPGMVVKAFAQALGVRERPQTPLFDDLAERLRGSELLIVLDNCEHLAEECALVANRLLQSCPGLRVLATSREPLGVPGEIVRRTASLALPPEDASTADIASAEAVLLLRDRAAAAVPGFELGDATAPLALRICRRLDGLPLAIELAAARLAMFSLHDLAGHLDDCFALLTGGTRTALPRQRTLEATVAWSYDLLSDVHRAVFDRLSVFAGGWTLDAAEEVCALGGMTERDVVDGLAALVEKSLVVRDELPDGRARYRLLETLRQYGRHRLQERAEAQAVRDAHLAWVVRLAEDAEPHLWGIEQAAWLDRLEEELDNHRAALKWSLASGDAESGIRILSIAVGSFWLWRGHVGEAGRTVERLLEHPGPVSDAVRIRGLITAGRLAFMTGVWEQGVARCEQALELSRAAGDVVGEARALMWRGINLWGAGGLPHDAEARRVIEEMVAAARRTNSPFEIALAAGGAAMWWADVDIDRARKLAGEAGEVIEQVPSPNWLAHVYEFRAYVAHVDGEESLARELLEAALPLYAQIGNHSCGAHCLESVALLAAANGRAEAGAELLGTASRLREQIGTVAPPYEEHVRKRGAAAIEAGLDADRLAAATERGRALTFEEAIDRATAVVGR